MANIKINNLQISVNKRETLHVGVVNMYRVGQKIKKDKLRQSWAISCLARRTQRRRDLHLIENFAKITLDKKVARSLGGETWRKSRQVCRASWRNDRGLFVPAKTWEKASFRAGRKLADDTGFRTRAQEMPTTCARVCN